ncbi:MAG: PAS domain S-box protein [Candidatus Aminicenantes bacterium]|nr:PAS domain S-box protein [Candidatus Aminicenantes bacterium]
MKKTKNNPDPNPLRVLILEDIPADAELVEHELHRAGIIFTSRLVDGKREFSKALAEFQPQVILSDFKLPTFDGMAALETARRKAPDIPFIFVSGSIGEEKAIETLALGASDYIFKDNLRRLGPAVKRVIEETSLQLEKKITNEDLRRRVEELRLLAEAAERFVQINDLDEMYEYLAQVLREISGADYLMLSLYDEKLQAVRPKIVKGFEPFRETLRRRWHIDLLQMVFYLKDMRPDDFSDFVSRTLLPVRDGLYGLANRKLPRQICRTIEKLLSIEAMFIMGFSWENQLYGGLTILFKKGNELQNCAQIEALLNLAAVSIKRLLAEKSLRESEEHLRESEEYYRTLVETSPDAIIIVDAGSRATFTSQKTLEIFGIPAQTSIIGTSIMNFVDPEEIPRVQGRMVEILSGRSLPQINEYRLLKHDRRPFWGEISSSPLRDAAGRSIGLLLICRDVTKRKQAEEELRISAEKWQSTFNSITDIVSVISMDHTFLEINKAGCDAMGLKREDIIGKKCYELVHDLHQPVVGCPCSLTIKSNKMEVGEVFENGHYYLLTAWPILDANGELLAFSHTVRDITERKLAEEQIRASLKEKEVLLQEIHHRVKNNLQIISGLLTLQADQAAGKSLEELFSASQDRIRSIALIHEKLYRSNNLAEIAFDEYLRALSENLFSSQGIAAGRITIKYDMEPILFTIEKAIPLGLIVNELITNSLKHAFPDGRQGEISIGLHECRGTACRAPLENTGLTPNKGTARRAPTNENRAPTYELAVADNGVGLPAGQVAEMEKTLGMKLIFMLAQQIKAELKVKTGPGAEFLLIFPGQPLKHEIKDKDHDG